MENPFYVGALILNPSNEILLQRKDLGYPKKQFAGMWTVFGGAGEIGEDPMETFYREVVKEETGLENLCEINLFRNVYIDETKYGVTHKPSKGPCYFYSARFDGDLNKIRLGEGAGFSIWAEEELKLIENITFPYVFEVIKNFYDSLR
ncbi:MAG: NUDIX hydrolase [Nanoarchaeota archaeon]